MESTEQRVAGNEHAQRRGPERHASPSDCSAGGDPIPVMAHVAASARRIRACYRGERADRIPIATPISWDPTSRIDAERPGGWRAEPDFVELAHMVERYCDPHPLWNPVPTPRVFAPYGYQRFLEAPVEYVESLPVEWPTQTRKRVATVLHTPKGDLHWVYEVEDGIETQWDLVKPINSLADVDRMLSVPWRFDPPAGQEFEPHRRNRAKMGRDAIGGVSVNSMVAMLCGVMHYEQMLEWLMTETPAIQALADAWLHRTGTIVDYLLDQGVGPCWHFNGVERACPPMMSPQQWERWVVPFDGAIMKRIRSRDPDTLIHVHCHGKVGTLLRSFMEMGVDSTDPVEPPPQGDIALADARRIVGDRMVLFGNIEFLDMERSTPAQIDELVRRAIADSGKRRLFLYPSATPHERHTPQFLANARRYLESALTHGAW